MITSAICRFGIEKPQSGGDGGQRLFENMGREIHILCDGPEDNCPIGRIVVTPLGIHIEIRADREELPVTITRTTTVSG